MSTLEPIGDPKVGEGKEKLVSALVVDDSIDDRVGMSDFVIKTGKIPVTVGSEPL